MKHDLTFVQLSEEQIALAKDANGLRKQITHGLVCGPHGQIFGTEKQCRKYYSAWVNIFPHLFGKGIETNNFEITNYKETFNLVNILIELHDTLENTNKPSLETLSTQENIKPKNGLISRLWASVSGS
jgi:hypothetical protein